MSPKGRRSRGAPYEAPRPIAGPEAFSDLRGRNHILSQAATLLLIGSHLRGDAPAAQARAEAVRGVMRLSSARSQAPLEAIPAGDIQALGFPSLQADTVRFRSTELQRTVGVRFAAAPAAPPTPGDVRAAAKSLPQTAAAFYDQANAQTAAALLEAGLRHPDQLVRVAAAASYFDVTTESRRAVRELESGLSSRDLLTRDVAAYALAHIDPKNPKLDKILRAKRRRLSRKPSHTSTIIHGTWAADSPWWQPVPAGDFWHYIHDNVDGSLYGASDRFQWTGGYSDLARSQGGDKLFNWVKAHQLDGLDVFTHSHGGSVAMLANHEGTQVGRMVLLSCPVHWPKYTPDFTRVGRAISVRVHLDLVILADRGGQHFEDARIEEHVIGVWFDHFATHKPDVWDKYSIKDWL
jgi:hypothetical protein